MSQASTAHASGPSDRPVAAYETGLRAVADDVSPEEHREFRRLLPAAVAEARAVAGHWDFKAPADVVDRLIEDTRAFSRSADAPHRTRLRRAAVARLALGFFRPEHRLPESIPQLYPAFFERLSTFLQGRAQSAYEDDYFAKDVRYALGLTIPCGALQFDLDAGVGPKLILRDLAATRSVRPGLSYVAALGWGRWYGNHLDLRAIRDFTPEGWTASFARIAEVLALNPSVRGVAGVAWFYDPALARVSPRLSYIRETPVRHGAFLVRMKTEPHDLENALAHSPSRKTLHQKGEYSPACYLLAWPRRALLDWAAQLKSNPSAAFGSNNEAAVGTSSPPQQHAGLATAS